MKDVFVVYAFDAEENNYTYVSIFSHPSNATYYFNGLQRKLSTDSNKIPKLETMSIERAITYLEAAIGD